MSRLPAAERIMRTMGRVGAALAGGSYAHTDEHALQLEIARRLTAAHIPHQRETALEAGDRPDFLVGDQRPFVALEVKVNGTRPALLRQVDGYAGDRGVGGILVATTRARHRALPATLRDKPLRVAWLTSAFAGAVVTAAPAVGQVVRAAAGWEVTLEPHAMVRFKRCFPSIRARHFGTIKLDGRRATSRDLAWFVGRYPVQMSDMDRAHLEVEARKHDDQAARFAAICEGSYEPRAFDLALPARGYQATAAELALSSGGLLIADEVGLGKTITAIAMLTDPATRPALVVTLTHLPHQWKAEIERFLPGTRVHILTKGRPYDVTRPKGARKLPGDPFHVSADPSRPFPDVLVGSYSKLAGWAETLAPVIRSVVYDEVQELRRGSGDASGRGGSAKARAAYHLSANVGYRLGLSATPVYNYGDEVHAVMEGLRPGALGTKSEFIREWCVQAGMSSHKVAKPAALGSWLRSEGLMLRRTRADVGRELPQLHIVPVCIEADIKAIDRARREVADLARLILGDDAKPLERGRASREIDWRLRQATGIAKAPFAAAFVQTLIADGADRVVLYGWHREVYRIWMDLLADLHPVMYTGSESGPKKRAAVARFVDRKSDCQVFVISLRSGAGLDGLQGCGCRHVVMGELDWSPQVHHQGIGRVHRDGIDDEVAAYFLHCDAGSDPAVMDVLGVKRSQSAGLLDPTGANPEPKAEPHRARALARRVLGR